MPSSRVEVGAVGAYVPAGSGSQRSIVGSWELQERRGQIRRWREGKVDGETVLGDAVSGQQREVAAGNQLQSAGEHKRERGIIGRRAFPQYFTAPSPLR